MIKCISRLSEQREIFGIGQFPAQLSEWLNIGSGSGATKKPEYFFTPLSRSIWWIITLHWTLRNYFVYLCHRYKWVLSDYKSCMPVHTHTHTHSHKYNNHIVGRISSIILWICAHSREQTVKIHTLQNFSANDSVLFSPLHKHCSAVSSQAN